MARVAALDGLPLETAGLPALCVALGSGISVVSWGRNHARFNRIQVDAGGHRFGGGPILHHHAFEGFLPQVATSFGLFVVSARKPLQQGFHEFGEIMHPAGEATIPSHHSW